MAYCERKWYDFVVYTNTGLSIERVDFNGGFWAEFEPKLKDFYDTFVMTKLIENVQVAP